MGTDDKHKPGGLEEEVKKKAKRRMRAQQRKSESPLLGFTVFGLIGWSVAVPTLLGALLGLWLDKHHPGKRSWTLMLLVAGLMLGSWNAWYWMKKESRDIHEEDQNIK